MTYLANLRQRKIVQWALAYLATAWLVMQLVDVLGSRWGVTSDTARLIDLLLGVGFLVALVIAWYHGERGHQKVSGTELIIIALIVGIGGFAVSLVDVSSEAILNDSASAKRAVLQPGEIQSAPWIAATQFVAPAGDAGLSDFASGLTTDITTGLSLYSHLLVLSRTTTESASTTTGDVRELGQLLGARYVMEGEMRQADSLLRLTVRLADTRDGTTVWSEQYERDLASAGVFEVQDDLTARIVATVADVFGVVMRTLAAEIAHKSPQEMTPYEAILQFSLNRQSVSAADHLATRTALERAVEIEPGYADAWAALGHVYIEEYISVYNPLPDPLDRALTAVQRAIDLDSTSPLAQYVLAMTQYFRRDVGAFRAAMERAIDLNPYDTQTMAMLGILLGYSGDWVRSVELTTRAMDLNPDHPGWFRFNTFFNEYRQRNYDAALDIAQRINLPEYWGDGLARTLAHAQLGNGELARAAADDLLRVWPTFEADYYTLGLENWMFAQPELIAHIIEGLRKAGLEMQVAPGQETRVAVFKGR